MSITRWEIARNNLQRLLLSGLMKDDSRISQMRWVTEYTKLYYQFFELLKNTRAHTLIEWCNLCHKNGVNRNDLTILIQEWKNFLNQHTQSSPQGEPAPHCP